MSKPGDKINMTGSYGRMGHDEGKGRHHWPDKYGDGGYEIQLIEMEEDYNACKKCGHSSKPVVWFAKILDAPEDDNNMEITEEQISAYRRK